jgi:hypothetical protein
VADRRQLVVEVGGKAGRSKTCRIEGLRNESTTWGRGRMEVASAEAVMGVLRSRNAWRLSISW